MRITSFSIYQLPTSNPHFREIRTENVDIKDYCVTWREDGYDVAVKDAYEFLEMLATRFSIAPPKNFGNYPLMGGDIIKLQYNNGTEKYFMYSHVGFAEVNV